MAKPLGIRISASGKGSTNGKDGETVGLKQRVAQLEAELRASREKVAQLEKHTGPQRTVAMKTRAIFAKELLPVADTLRQALEYFESGDDPRDPETARLIDGVSATERQLHSALQKAGLRPIDALGTAFDPNLHEALFQVDDSDAPDGTVVRQVQRGWALGRLLLRPARVGVAKTTARSRSGQAVARPIGL